MTRGARVADTRLVDVAVTPSCTSRVIITTVAMHMGL